jgi:hypothetical protein
MEIDHDLQASALCPVQCLAELLISTLHVWVAISWQNTPVTDGNSDVVQTRSSHFVEVVLCDPRVPMLLQLRLGSIFAELLSKSPLIYSRVALEDGGSNPWLENEPATSVDTANFLAAVGE